MSLPTAKLDYLARNFWPGWASELEEHRCLFLPGIMGSQLIDSHCDRTVWVDLEVHRDMRRLGFESLTPLGGIDSDGQQILANRTVDLPVVQAPYAEFAQAIPAAQAAYDWRENMFISADWLSRFLRHAFARFSGRISVVTHSMGGCVLLSLLAGTHEFDERIEQIIFVAPPFHGALHPVRVVEYGQGTPVDSLVVNDHVKQVSATMPGLFQLALAPRGKWPTRLPRTDVELQYPVRGPGEVHHSSFWSEPEHPMRDTVLHHAREFHRLTDAHWPGILHRLRGRLHLIVGINGRNTLSRMSGSPGQWRFHKNSAPPAGRHANGDGTVLLQSSMLPGFDCDRIWAYVSPSRKSVHGGMMDFPEVIDAIAAILEKKTITRLLPYCEFIGDVDFSRETADAETGPWDDLDFQERARLRRIVPELEWAKARLLGDGDDVELLHATHAAVSRILDQGAQLADEAKGLNKDVDHLFDSIRRGLMPF